MTQLLRDRTSIAIAAFVLLYALGVALIQHSYALLILAVLPLWAVMGLSWNLMSGYSGYVSFGHAAFFGLGAYFVALSQIHLAMVPWISIPIAALIGAFAGLLVGLPTFRLRGHYFALAMLAYPLALLYLFEWMGYQELALPMRRDAAVAYMQFDDHRYHAWLALALLAFAMFITHRVERSRFGLSLLAIREDEAAAEAAGIPTTHWKLRAIALSGALAGAAGGLYAIILIVVTPAAVFGMLVSAQALIVAMFGGVASIWGPVLGALILIPLSAYLEAHLGDSFPGIQGVVYGVAIIIVILRAPEGLYWKLRDWRRRPAPGSDSPHTAPDVPIPPPASRHVGATVLLQTRGVSKAFGGVQALRAVDFDVRQGEILGIIGPNGSGKTTLFNVLNGFIRPDQGDIQFDGRSMTGLTPQAVCAAGIGRTFQVARPFRRLSVLDNVMAGAFLRSRTDAQARVLALSAIERAGLSPLMDRTAGELTNKEQRLLEIARALAGKPRLLLLDETLAGLSTQDAIEVLDLIRRLAASGITVVVIEHTMQAMVRLVDRFVVLNEGAVLAQGAPSEITRQPEVIDAYLGRKWRERHA